MIENMITFIVTVLIFTPLLAWGMMHLLIGFFDGLHVKIDKIEKGTILLWLTFFFISIELCYRTNFHFPPLLDILKELIFSLILGLLWMKVFYRTGRGFGFMFKKQRKVYMWTLFSALAFGVYILDWRNKF